MDNWVDVVKSRRLPVAWLFLALISAFLVLILRSPEMPYLDQLRRGDERAARAERAAAAVAYREATRLRPGDASPYLRLAQLYLDWGRVEDALDAIIQAEQLGAEGVELERLRVAVSVARADWPAVVEYGQRLLELVSSANAEEVKSTRHILARAYVELREWDAAQAEYETLLRIDPTDSLAHERLGVLLLGDDPAAVQHLFAAGTVLADRLLAALQEPSAANDTAYINALLGRELVEERQWALSTRYFERAIADIPAYADAHAYLGYALDQMGHADEAGPHLLQAVALNPESAVMHTFLGLHYDRSGDVAAARAEYEVAYDLDPDNPAICVEIGQTWAAEGRYVAAEIWLREAVSLQPDDPALWQVLTRFYLEHNMMTEEQGIASAVELVELAPEDARAHDLRGWAALQVGDYAAAQDSLRQAISLDPTLASAHYHLGLWWLAQGARQRAQDAFIRAVDLDTTGELVPLIERALGEAPD
jgi:tetratricopeptide (TPR) repeat protein